MRTFFVLLTKTHNRAFHVVSSMVLKHTRFWRASTDYHVTRELIVCVVIYTWRKRDKCIDWSTSRPVGWLVARRALSHSATEVLAALPSVRAMRALYQYWLYSSLWCLFSRATNRSRQLHWEVYGMSRRLSSDLWECANSIRFRKTFSIAASLVS